MFEQRVYLQYGNGTETHYAYDSLRRRLSTLTAATASGRFMMNNSYGYDAVSNILNITNSAKPVVGKLGGGAIQKYAYDNLYRLVSAGGIYRGARDSGIYSLSMAYDNLYNITSKNVTSQPSTGFYSQNYTYAGTVHQATSIGNNKYTYDLNGNQLTYAKCENFWDEENRLQGAIDNGTQSEYTYDAGGERVIKSSGGVQGNWVNGAPAGTINHYDNYTVYVSPYLVCQRTSFTKHIYIESQRITTKIGNGQFTNISFPQTALSAGGINYIARSKQLEKDRITYYASLGITPGPPTNKLFYAEPQNSGIAAPVLVDSTVAVPPGWPGNVTPPTTGPPVTVQPIPSNDSAKAGYGFIDTTKRKVENNQYFYHPDHLGSTAYVTNATGEVTQHAEYIPFGETYFDEHASGYQSPYLFNAKEKDIETGLYYYGARYYNPQQSQWISVDPMADKYPGLSPYNYALNNPVRLVDPNGMELGDVLEDFFSIQVAYYKGLGQAVVGTAEGLAHVATHPIETGEAIASAAYNYKETAHNVSSAANNLYQEFKNGDNVAKANILGKAVGTIALAFVGGEIGEGADGIEATTKVSKTADLGKYSDYIDITEENSIRNVKTNVGKSEFGANLEQEGFTKSVSKDGKVINYTKGDIKYSVRDNARSTGGPTADYSNGTKYPTLKIRLGGQ